MADQHTADMLLKRGQIDLKNEQAVCGSMLTSLSRTPAAASRQTSAEAASAGTPDGGGTENADRTADGGGTVNGGGTKDDTPTPDTSACTMLLSRILAEQTTLSEALEKISADEDALDAAVVRLLADSHAAPTAGSGTPGGSGANDGQHR